MWWIQIPRRSTRCSGCSTRFEPKSRYHTFLTEKEDESWERKDFCSKCSEEIPDKKSLVGKWDGLTPDKKERGSERLSMPALIEELKELFESEEVGERKLAFLIAQHLLRKRALLNRGTTEKGDRKALLLEVPETEEMLVIESFPLSELSAEDLKKVWAGHDA